MTNPKRDATDSDDGEQYEGDDERRERKVLEQLSAGVSKVVSKFVDQLTAIHVQKEVEDIKSDLVKQYDEALAALEADYKEKNDVLDRKLAKLDDAEVKLDEERKQFESERDELKKARAEKARAKLERAPARRNSRDEKDYSREKQTYSERTDGTHMDLFGKKEVNQRRVLYHPDEGEYQRPRKVVKTSTQGDTSRRLFSADHSTRMRGTYEPVQYNRPMQVRLNPAQRS